MQFISSRPGRRSQAVERLKRAKAEAAALWTDATDKRSALQRADDNARHLVHEPGQGLVLHSTGKAAEPWPAFEEVAAAFKRHGEKEAEVDELREAVKRMTGLDRDLLS